MESSNPNASLPSFVELMASLGLQDEHSAHALLRGASLADEPIENYVTGSNISNDEPKNHNMYRNSSASAASLEHELPVSMPTPTLVDTPNSLSLSTPLSSASLLTPLNSPPAQQRDRPTSHGKKRYSPYGLSAPVVNDYRDIYARRGSVPGTTTELENVDKRQLHHQSVPNGVVVAGVNVNTQRFSVPESMPSLERRLMDTDGDEEMRDAATSLMSLPNRSQPAIIARTNAFPTQSQTSHCAGQPNLLMTSRQRNPRGVLGPRTKSQTHLRPTISGTSNDELPPLPSSDFPNRQKNSSPYNSIGRRSGRTVSTSSTSTGANGSFIDIGLDNEGDVSNNATVVSISSYLRRSQPPLPSSTIETVPESPSAASTSASRSHHLSLPRVGGVSGLKAPPSAPPTKTTFGFGPGGVSTGGASGAVRRARHARSSSARSVRDMIREREPLVPIAPLHSFHPLMEDMPSISTVKRPPLSRGESSDGTANASTTSLPLDDTSRSFSQRRRTKRPNKRNSPPPPLMLLPTLPLNFSIKAIVGATSGNASESAEDRLGAPDIGYVSRRDPHSPDARATWRTRRTTPPAPAPVRAMPMAVMES